MVAVGLWLRAASDLVYFEPTGEALRAASIARPKVAGYGVAVVVLVAAALAQLPRRWSAATRAWVVVTALALAACTSAMGVVASDSRRADAVLNAARGQPAASSASLVTTRQFRVVAGTPSCFSTVAFVSLVRP